MQDHFKKYVKEINKLSFEKHWEYVQKKLVSKNNVDIKFKDFFIILEGYFISYEGLCHDNNIKIGKKSNSIFGFYSNYVKDYFPCNRGGFIAITSERLSGEICNVFIPIDDGNYIKSELHFRNIVIL